MLTVLLVALGWLVVATLLGVAVGRILRGREEAMWRGNSLLSPEVRASLVRRLAEWHEVPLRRYDLVSDRVLWLEARETANGVPYFEHGIPLDLVPEIVRRAWERAGR